MRVSAKSAGLVLVSTYGMILFMCSDPGIVPYFLPEGTGMIHAPLPQVAIRVSRNAVLFGNVLLKSMTFGRFWARMAP